MGKRAKATQFFEFTAIVSATLLALSTPARAQTVAPTPPEAPQASPAAPGDVPAPTGAVAPVAPPNTPAPAPVPVEPTAIAPAPTPQQGASADDEIRDLRQRLDAVEERQRTLRGKNAVLLPGHAEPGVAVASADDGVAIRSADGRFTFRLRQIVQTDGRFYVKSGTNEFLMRRVRPYMEGTAFGFFDWRIMPELAGTPVIEDAYGNVGSVASPR